MSRAWILAGLAAGLQPGSGWAEDGGVYDLGEIHVSAPSDKQQTFDAFGGSTLSHRVMDTFGKDSLDKAVALIPGVSSAPTGNQRNETNLFVHGFDRWQVPLSIDGIPIYLPADNRLDFSRFLTGDVSEVQIAKGYASVLDGPGGMGGAVNLVTRKPTKRLEGEISSEMSFGNNGTYDGLRTYLRAGSKLDAYYFQVSGSVRNVAGWELPSSFSPTANENGGRRDWSTSHDRNVNIKAGYTPNGTDEYSVSFIRQEGVKQAPYNVDPTASNRYWSWPWWNVQTLSAATKTAIGDDAYLKTKIYWETFETAIDMYDDAAQTKKYSASNAQHSEYSDWALGGSIEIGKNFGTVDTLKGAVFYRRDNHSEQNQYFVDQFGLNQATTKKSTTCLTSATVYYKCFLEPKQTDVEDTYSIALENTYHLTPAIDLIQGISYDYRNISQAQDYVLGSYSGGSYYNPYWVDYGKTNSGAFNWQAGAVWRYDDTGKLFANVSDRTRFPTLFELYSTRFGSAASNPGLRPERAINYQIGWTKAYAQKSQVSVSAYFASVYDLIQSVATGATYTDPITLKTSSITQNRNVGDGYRYGLDVSVDHALRDDLTIGGNFSLIQNVVSNPTVSNFRLTGIPSVKGFLYANYKPIESVTLTPSMEFADANWTSSTISGTTTYFKTGAYVLANLSGEYKVTESLSVSAGVKNIFDRDYTLAWGYPSQGRNYFLAMKASF